jgi:hypothetical protein
MIIQKNIIFSSCTYKSIFVNEDDFMERYSVL